VQPDPNIWRGRRILITGHTGFKGSWLVAMLRAAGADIAGLALEPQTSPNLFTLLELEREIDSRIVDVRDLELVRKTVFETKPEIVFHLAAQALVRAGYDSPVETFATNVMGTANLLEALRDAEGLRAVVVVTSDKCYKNREWLWGYREDEMLGGEDPYSSSKAAAELVTHAYRRSFFAHGARIATARAGNVIGGGDWATDRLVPDVINASLRGEPPALRSPHSVRPWQHVVEPLAGYMTLAEKLLESAEFADAWNFGPVGEQHVTVAGLAQALLTAMGRPPDWVAGEQGPHEAKLLRLDATKARTLLGWRSKLDDAAAVAWTAAWYRAWHEGENVRALTLSQIEEYWHQ